MEDRSVKRYIQSFINLKTKTTSREYHTYILTRVGVFSFSIYTFTHIYISHPIYLYIDNNNNNVTTKI